MLLLQNTHIHIHTHTHADDHVQPTYAEEVPIYSPPKKHESEERCAHNVRTFHFAIAVGASQQFTRGSSPGAAAAKPRRLAAARSAPGATHVAAFAVAGDAEGRARMSKDAERAEARAEDDEVTNTDITPLSLTFFGEQSQVLPPGKTSTSNARLHPRTMES